MTELHSHLKAKFHPETDKRKIIEGEGFRISVLTERLIRLEKSNDGKFCDDATQAVFNRNFPHFHFIIDDIGDAYVIKTERSEFVFIKRSMRFVKITVDGKSLDLSGGKNLKGTCRTLDMRIGKVKLGDGVVSEKGLAYFEDKSMALCEDGSVKERSGSDEYIFAYGHDYRAALKDFYFLCGKTPYLPRYVLGNWWSRYRAYTQDEYLAVMKKFADKNVPITVATVDMDWHWVKVNEKFGTNFKAVGLGQSPGWTGYSWNTDLFPDYKKFLRTLRENGYRVTLNLHPSSGVRFFEDRYEDMAKALGVDPSTKQTIPFDLNSSAFINAYFDILHHGYEEEGVDFWWIDWQQGKKSTVKGLDPLWALNHYHFLDNDRADKRGLILSRFSGAGSHRYPLGFSGDYIIRWKSLEFQPYMTATASNIGYSWWSHDIGGHTFGIYDDELYLRWCQLGVFSPVNRLHSSNHDLMGKEPWKHSGTTERVVSDFLRLRHRMIPYLYTAMQRTSEEGVALCEPVYYSYPDEKLAYKIKNEYFFGSELLVCPVTSKINKKINMAKTKVWLPEGRFTDIFTGKVYEGGKLTYMFRDLESIPVLAKEGAIIPLSDDEGNVCGNPKNIELLIYRGNNTYSLYEDDGETKNYLEGEYAYTDFTVKEEDGKITFTVSEPRYGKEDCAFKLPEGRRFKLNFKDVFGGSVKINGDNANGEIIVKCGDTVTVENYAVATVGDRTENARDVLSKVRGNNLCRIIKYIGLKKIKDPDRLLKKIKRRFGKNVYLACKE